MKCPKCEYLGFETGDRCKNCGYDFSLMTVAPAPAPFIDMTIAPPAQQTPDTKFWLDQLDQALGKPIITPPLELPAIASPAAQTRAEAALPLFLPPLEADDDQPLIKLPLAPRAPLSVRKTPDTPRLRAVPKAAPRAREPVPLFPDEAVPEHELSLREAPAAPVAVTRAAPIVTVPSAAGARLAAVALDYVILFGIDAAVLYLTLRMTALTMAEWSVLPLVPLAAFLVLVKFAYFCAFTAVGGQTIGKMALGLRVVTDDDNAVDVACAIRRTLAGLISAVTFGAGFLPALIGGDGRAIHDRFAHTRVVALRPA